MKNIKTWRERADERGIGSCEARDEEITELRAKLKQQTELVEKCMVAMNENADRGEKAEARLAALESQEPVAAIHVNHINGESSAILFNRITLHHGDNLYAAAGAEPGDIRALKHRIHELEGEVIGYKRILSDSEAKAPVPEGWKPIETAPKDATSILVYCPNARRPVQEVWWAIPYEGSADGYWSTPVGPLGRGYIILPEAATHWMPLPVTPKAPTE